MYGGASAIKQRLLPLLGQGFFASGISTDTSLSILEDVGRKQREVTDLQVAYDESLERLESDLNVRLLRASYLRSALHATALLFYTISLNLPP